MCFSFGAKSVHYYSRCYSNRFKYKITIHIFTLSFDPFLSPPTTRRLVYLQLSTSLTLTQHLLCELRIKAASVLCFNFWSFKKLSKCHSPGEYSLRGQTLRYQSSFRTKANFWKIESILFFEYGFRSNILRLLLYIFVINGKPKISYLIPG